jgi:uncharacterized damage-inducible protein DinB
MLRNLKIMKNDKVASNEIKDDRLITPSEMLEHWQGHRRLTRRVINAFPEDKLFTYSIGGMRPFAVMAMEFIGMAEPGIIGIATGVWKKVGELPHHSGIAAPKTKETLLERWDYVTEQINKLWPDIPPHRFNEKEIAFGQWEGPIYSFIQYWVDNEIHHRGQGYVYLRALDIEPPPFWERN